jgi:DNA-binding protein Fis
MRKPNKQIRKAIGELAIVDKHKGNLVEASQEIGIPTSKLIIALRKYRRMWGFRPTTRSNVLSDDGLLAALKKPHPKVEPVINKQPLSQEVWDTLRQEMQRVMSQGSLDFESELRRFRLLATKTALEETIGNKAGAAKKLGLNRSSLLYHLNVWTKKGRPAND